MSSYVGSVAVLERIPDAALEETRETREGMSPLYVHVFARAGHVELCAEAMTLLPGGARELGRILIAACDEAERLSDPTRGRGKLRPPLRVVP